MTPCGCAGKTPLARVVEPARRRARSRLARRGVHLAGRLDCGLLPRRTRLERDPAAVALDAGEPPAPGGDGPAWGVAAVLAGRSVGTSPGAFADAMVDGYGTLAGGARLRVVKGHSVQTDATGTTVVAERLRPRGPRRPGYTLANVDLVHDFPGRSRPTVARVAALHALDDCYAYGGHAERVVRPVVGVPSTADRPDDATVAGWYRTGLPDGIDVLAPLVVGHAGRGWLFGATATTRIEHTPPLHAGRLDPGDCVLLSRPLGAVAALAAARAGLAGDGVTERAVTALRRDQVAVAEAVAAASPGGGEAFDPDRHLALATDVSGPGVGGIADLVGRGPHRLHVERLPFLDRPAVEAARDRWLLPDATLGTNGPVALAGRPAVLERIAARLRGADLDPVPLGRVVTGEGRVSSAAGVDLARFVEDRRLLVGEPE